MSFRPAALIAALTLPLLPAPLAAQAVVAPQTSPMAAAKPPMIELPSFDPGTVIDFAADSLDYDEPGQIVTATGNVAIDRDGWTLRADRVVYNRETGEVEAHGNVISTDPKGNRVFGDRIVLTDSLRDGSIDNILLVLDSGGRLAAKSGVRVNGKTVMTRAVFSPCHVTDDDGCPKAPLWQVRAQQVTHDPARHRISYRDATLDFWGQPILYLPKLSHPDGTTGRASGILLPSLRYNAALGLGVAVPFLAVARPDRDLLLTPWLYTGANPALGVNARRLFAAGPVQAEALMTWGGVPVTAADGSVIGQSERFRGYFAANGQFQHDASWRSTFSFRYATDDTFTRRYDITYDDTLRNTYALERFGSDSYLSIEGWAFQGLRLGDDPAKIPLALPLISFRWNPAATVLGGLIGVNANTVVISRSRGQDIQRGIVAADWTMLRLTPWGQRVTVTGQLRGDVYHTANSALADLPSYAGRDGWQARFIPAAAIDVDWPFAGPVLGGIQTIAPRIQFSISPTRRNIDIPNEDSRALSFDTVNLFDLNRFPGYDRWEGGSRLTYGVEYRFNRPRLALTTQIGQSYRFEAASDFPVGTGLVNQFSDIVARTTLQLGRRFDITQAVRFDKDSLAVRENEIDLSYGTAASYVSVAYVKLNRGVTVEDLTNREELRVGGRIVFAKYWSVFASTILDLTSTSEDPTTTNNGFSPVRHRIGIAYEDECFRIGISWRHDYTFINDYQPGNTYLFNVAFKTFSKAPVAAAVPDVLATLPPPLRETGAPR